MRRLIGLAAVLALGVWVADRLPGLVGAGQRSADRPTAARGRAAGTATPRPRSPRSSSRSCSSTVRNGQDQITHCYTEEMERQKDKKLAGNVLVKILIGTNERADQVVIGEHTLKGSLLRRLHRADLKSLEFPRLNSPSWFTYPFEFSPAY